MRAGTGARRSIASAMICRIISMRVATHSAVAIPMLAEALAPMRAAHKSAIERRAAKILQGKPQNIRVCLGNPLRHRQRFRLELWVRARGPNPGVKPTKCVSSVSRRIH